MAELIYIFIALSILMISLKMVLAVIGILLDYDGWDEASKGLSSAYLNILLCFVFGFGILVAHFADEYDLKFHSDWCNYRTRPVEASWMGR